MIDEKRTFTLSPHAETRGIKWFTLATGTQETA